ncbi:MAG: hypothetical protein HC906_08020 [Bacteroidales bacterium]|nr:hypothetical protein [Bacteroidales bacterium]
MVFVLTAVALHAQLPEYVNYQAVIRNSSGSIRANEVVNIKLSIIQGAPLGTEFFSETHETLTNEFGLVTLYLGSINKTEFRAIDWSNYPFFLKVEVDGITMGTSPILSVPYSF